MRNRQALIFLLLANIVSEFAHGIVMLAIPWYFTQVLERPSLFGSLFAVITFLTLFWGLYGGTLIDRYPRKNVFTGLMLAGALILGGIAFSGFGLGAVPAGLVILAFAATILNFNVHYPTLYAFAQEITERQDYSRTNSLIEVQGQATRMFASAVGALLLAGTEGKGVTLAEMIPFRVEKWTLSEIFLLDAGAYVLAFLLIQGIRYTPTVPPKVDKGPLKERFRTGLRFLRANPLIFLFGNASYMIFVFVIVQAFFLMPVYVDDHLGLAADVYAVGEVLFAMGALVAGLTIRWVIRRWNTLPAVVAAMGLTVLVFYLCAVTRSLFIFLLFNTVLGITNSGVRVMRITYLFDHVPNWVIGRSNSVFQAINTLLRSIFTALFSLAFFAEGGRIVWAYFICGTVVLLAMVPLLYHYASLRAVRPVRE